MKTEKQILHRLEILLKECDIFEEKLKSASAHPLQHQQYQEAVRIYNARISELNWVYYGDKSK